MSKEAACLCLLLRWGQFGCSAIAKGKFSPLPLYDISVLSGVNWFVFFYALCSLELCGDNECEIISECVFGLGNQLQWESVITGQAFEEMFSDF